MTGFGEARTQTDRVAVGVEVRAVNNRHLKVTVRGSDPYPMLEAEIEKVIRRHVRRGTLLVQVHVERAGRTTDLKLNTEVLADYLRQIRTACDSAGTPDYAAPLLAGVLALPGIAPESAHIGSPPDEEWPAVEKTLEAALVKLDGMRRDEGRAMGDELLNQHHAIAVQLEEIKRHLPAVMGDYRQRLLDRVKQAVGDASVAVTPEHLIREIALFADRSDVAEEVTRLTSHLVQFAEIVRKGDEGAGRKLEFVIQEMGREANTLGSKAGDVTISRHVVEIKAAMEKIRELVQNVE
ncbi:MAG TPA: YicC/YloC family endoribonuclease [Gemmataceae bacterium]|nr:YicC/YloC family endoribonuclease [Gemmataceae bacterium]